MNHGAGAFRTWPKRIELPTTEGPYVIDPATAPGVEKGADRVTDVESFFTIVRQTGTKTFSGPFWKAFQPFPDDQALKCCYVDITHVRAAKGTAKSAHGIVLELCNLFFKLTVYGV